MSYIVALTGGIGSGKSTVSNIFSKLGVPVVDSDVIAKNIVLPKSLALDAIIKRFGLMILDSDGFLNRTLLREKIFKNKNDKLWLNRLLHPLIQRYTEYQFNYVYKAIFPYIIWVVPLLIENNLQYRANRILVVDVETKVQIARLLNRDEVTIDQINNILSSQISRQKRLSSTNDIIDNNGSYDEIIDKVIALHLRYLIYSTNSKKFDKKNGYINQIFIKF